MLPFSATLASQIRFLLESADGSNCDSIYRELCQFVGYGSEASILLLQTCLYFMNLNGESNQSEQGKVDVVSSIFRFFLDKPNFSTVFCEALRTVTLSEGYLENLSKALDLSITEKIGVGLALSDSENQENRVRGQNFFIAHIEELCANTTSIVLNERIQDVFMFLSRYEGLSKHVDSFTKMLSLLQCDDSSLYVLAPILGNDLCAVKNMRHMDLFYECSESEFDVVLAEIEKEMSMADVIKELGYECTVTASHCEEMLSLFLPLNELTIAKLLGTIVRSHMGLEDAQTAHSTFCSASGTDTASDSSWLSSWNVDVLVDSINKLAPKTSWMLVMENLDHEGFYVPDETAFSLLMSIYDKACQDPFPLHAVCGSVWKNAEGQISFLKYAVSASPDIFTFAHSARQLEYDTALKVSHMNGNQGWICLDLLEILCQLAERGHASSVRMMLEQPLNQFPIILALAIAQINTAYNLIQYEVSSAVFPSILADPMKSSIIHHLWAVNPSLVLRGFVEFYSADQNSMSKILDICHELKILSSVLEMSPFLFSIKLAAYASRKEYINLEEWLSENLSAYKDAFVEDCLKFLKEIVSNAANDGAGSPFQQSDASFLKTYQETCSIFFKVLQSHLGQLISHHLVDEVKRLHASFNSTAQNVATIDSSPSGISSEDIEAETNAYFHQMFSGQLSIEVMVQMLARFKESAERREQLVFECMIGNLFEEYKFVPKYPDRQLKLAAILFGSLIKHQLVTHLALGIALRGVLDALRKSVDSKMFMFGTKALEQFVDRLVEWPQYCNHILQISHLRGTHPELVSVIERALARISSSQSDSNDDSPLSSDQHQGSGHASTENIAASESSWQLVSPSTVQSGQQLSSPLQLHRKHQPFLDEKPKPSASPVNFVKNVSSHAAQSSLLSVQVDSVSSQKASVSQLFQNPSSHHSATAAASVSSSPGFPRPTRSLTPAGMLRQPSYSTGFGAALNIETLVSAAERRDAPIEVPISEIQDKILFMINNISTANMDSKAKEFTEVLQEQYYPWFAQYMVMKRASIEPNFHDLYLKFLEKVNSKTLNQEIVKATYENCKVLLKSELIKSSSEERSLLKNLGSWLGKFTIGRNQVLRAREIDPKSLIIEAYEKGLMIAVIPFTSKILEPCQSSVAYQPPNPWTTAILALLVEIYNLPNLKMNLKFDIEVLFKNLCVDMKEVKPTSLLKDRAREVEGNPDFSNKDATASLPAVISEANSGVIPALNQVELQQEAASTTHAPSQSGILTQYSAPLHPSSNSLVDDDKLRALMIPERTPSAQGSNQVTQSSSPFSLSQLLTIFPSTDSEVMVNPRLNEMGLQLQFRRIFQMAIDRAIREIVSPVIQRSVTIAMRTTKELVLKDYAMESDENNIKSAAHKMVGTLAGSLAHVTCKEPLRIALSNHLRTILQLVNVANSQIEQIVTTAVTDNLDLGCAVIENVASTKAVHLIDAEILPSFASIKKQREASASAYYDAGTYAQGPFARLPEALRPKPGCLSIAQQRVYNDFTRYLYQSSQSSNAEPVGAAGGSVSSSLSRVNGSGPGQPSSMVYSSSQITAGLGVAGQPLDLISDETDRGSSQVLSLSLNSNGVNDGGIQHSGEMSSLADMEAVAPPVLSRPRTPISERLGTMMSETLLTTGDALDKYQVITQKLESLIAKEARDVEVQGVVAEVRDIILRCLNRDEAALAVAQKVFKSLYENASDNIHIASHIAILAAIRDVCMLVVKELTSWVIYSDEDRRFNKDITVRLICSDLLNLAEYNAHLAKLIDGGRNKAATEFAISLVQALLPHQPGVSMPEFHNVIDALAKLAMRPGSPESLQQLVEIARNSTSNLTPLPGFSANKDEKARHKKVIASGNESAVSNPVGFRDKVSSLFEEWFQICNHPATYDAIYSHYISKLQQAGFLNGDDTTDRFFRILTELSVTHCLGTEQAISPSSWSLQSPQPHQHLSFLAIDLYSKLVVLVLKYCSVDQGPSKVVLLPKILSVTVRVLQKEADDKKSSFNPRPYFRLFVNWLLDLPSSDPVVDGANFQVLTSFANAFHALQPLKVPGWSFAWLELVSHRSFMPKLLTINSPKGWPFFQRLLVDLFKFMEPYLRNAELGEPVQFLYKGSLRVLLVLLHDFPDFLCDYHFSFCDVIPPSCIQMRNVILSAFPRNMKLPDPSTPNLKIDLLAEISQTPHVLSDVDGALKAKQIKADLDEYLKTSSEGSSFLSELKQRLLLPQNEASLAGTRYNVPLINSLVLYVGMQAIQQLQSKSTQHATMQQLNHSPPMDIFLVGAAMDIFQSLIKSLDTEGRYLFLNAIANQLRYPNNHTHYFSFVLLYLFAEASQEIVQEQITRVLLERLIVNRPHPWGLLITFIELIKNPRYNFWSRSFTRCAPEIEKLFESVSRSCGGARGVDDGMVSGGIPDGGI